MPQEKPPVRFCWLCGRKLWGNHYALMQAKADSYQLVLHKSCAKLLENDPAYERTHHAMDQSSLPRRADQDL